MEIIVEGKGSTFFTPNQVIMNFNFITKGSNYKEVLKYGSLDVKKFIDEIFLQNNFLKEDLKTSSFIIKEETKYNDSTKKYESDGYSYNQVATLKFDYDKDLLAKLMEMISKLDNPPKYRINFGIKNETQIRRTVLNEAYKDAEQKALSIAIAAGKNLKQCIKVDFKQNSSCFESIAYLNSDSIRMDGRSVSETIINVFTPEDIEITEYLYCVWIAE